MPSHAPSRSAARKELASGSGWIGKRRPASHTNSVRHASARGQSLVEFALLLPMLLILLLGVADFGRVFHAGIVLESASRAAAEAAALEYLRTADYRPDPGDPGFDAYYARIRAVASEAACQEARVLPNTTYVGGTCPGWPAALACVHDGQDPACDGSPAAGFSAGPAACDRMGSPGWSHAVADAATTGAYVEVRLCYRFTTLFDLSLSLPFGASLNLGETHLQQRAAFTVADY